MTPTKKKSQPSRRPAEEMAHEELLAKLDRVIDRLAKVHAAVKS
jgi:hypothetical protein